MLMSGASYSTLERGMGGMPGWGVGGKKGHSYAMLGSFMF